MTQRPASLVSWPRWGAWVVPGVVALTLLWHLVLIWYASGLMWHPKVVWVQAVVPLQLQTPPPPSAAPLMRAAKAPQIRRVAPPKPPLPLPASDAAAKPVDPAPDPAPTPAMAAVDMPAEPAAGGNDATETASAPDPSTQDIPEAQATPDDPGPPWLLGQPSALPRQLQSASYKVYGLVNALTYHASSSLVFEPQGERGYSLSYKVGAFLLGSRKQISQGQISTNGLEPLSFTDQTRRTQVTQVNADQKTVKLPNNPSELAWVPGTQDRLSVFVQLGAWLAATPTAFEQGKTYRLSVWSSRETETWLIASQGIEKLNTPYGEQTATRLSRLPLGPGDARVDMWFVPQWGAVPVRIEMVEANGNRAEQSLSELDPPPSVKSP